jgi:hypothetical protein
MQDHWKTEPDANAIDLSLARIDRQGDFCGGAGKLESPSTRDPPDLQTIGLGPIASPNVTPARDLNRVG